MNAIRPLEGLAAPLAQGRSEAPEAQRTGRSFGESMTEALSKTDALLVEADQAAVGVADGSVDAVEALITLSKAELALRHVVSMSTRALEAYREVMRMQL